jgi:cytoskeletal protein CcmA (bactofilin family)
VTSSSTGVAWRLGESSLALGIRASAERTDLRGWTARRPSDLAPRAYDSGAMLRRHPRLAAFIAAFLLVPVFTAIALAQSGTALENVRTGDTVTIPAGETVEGDLYAFAGTVRVDGTIQGDLVTTAGQVDVSGSVEGDILAAGGQVNVSGTVGDDVRVAGGTVSLSGTATEDALLAGGTVTITSAAEVGGDVITSAGQLVIDGTVTGSVVGSASTYARGGQIGGVEDVRVGPQPGVQPAAPPSTASRVLDAVRHFLVVLLVGALLLWLVPRAYDALQSTVRNRPAASVGWGIVGIIGFVVLLIVIAIATVVLAAIIGLLGFGGLVAAELLAGIIAFAGLILVFGVVAAWVADAIVGAAIASLIPQNERASRWQELALMAAGAAVVVFVSSLPIVGPLAKLVVVIFGLGALLVAVSARRRRAPVAPPPAWGVQPPAPTPAEGPPPAGSA